MHLISKRKRFVISSFLLSLGFLGIQSFPESFRFVSIGVLGIFTLIFFILSLWEGLSKDATLLTLILPFFYTLSMGLFWYLLPSSIFYRALIVISYGIGIYGLNMTMNIYTVSAIRTIALLRAARGVGFVLTLFTLFLIFDNILSIRLYFYWTSLITALISFPIYLQGFWSATLEKYIGREVILTSLVSSLATAEIMMSLFFWPVTVAVGSSFLTLTAYVLLGLGQSYLEGRLFTKTVVEYLVVAVLVFIIMYSFTSWRGF